jgi:hypothetical protein
MQNSMLALKRGNCTDVAVMIMLAVLVVVLANSPGVAQDTESYPALPSVDMTIEGQVALSTLEQIANHHAHRVWGDAVACGQPLPICDATDKLTAYVFPVSRSSQQFPAFQEIFDQVGRSRQLYREGHRCNEQGFEADFAHKSNQYGSVYVSATRDNFPIPRVDHFLHPYFISAVRAQQQAERQLGVKAHLESIVAFGPDNECYKFSGNGRDLLIDIRTLETREYSQIRAHTPDRAELDLIKSSWASAEKWATGNSNGTAALSPLAEKLLTNLPLVPPIIWTLNCATTAKAMVLGYWDHYSPGNGTILGFGRLIDYWYEHPSNGENVPNLLEEVHAAYGMDVWQINKYSCEWTEITAKSDNNWAWQEYMAEIDNNRPACWSFEGHTMAGIGYRTDPIEQYAKWAITYDTWSTNRSEFTYTICIGVAHIVPLQGSGLNHMIITSPYSGETYYTSTPAEVKWYVWGSSIDKTNLYYSTDAGLTWTLLAGDVATHEGENVYYWIPGAATTKGRIRAESYAATDYIAGDGSYGNFTVEPQVATGNWVRISDPVNMVVAGYDKSGSSRLIFATDKTTGDIFEFMGVPGSAWNWIQVGHPGAKFVLDRQGKLYGLAVDSQAVYQYSGTPMQWTQIGNAATDIFPDVDGVCATSPASGDLYRYLGVPFSWRNIGCPGSDYGCDAHGNLYCIAAADGAVWRYTGLFEAAIPWEQIGQSAAHLYTNGLGIYATNPSSGDIYFNHGQPSDWTLVGGPANSFSPDWEGRLYALSTDKTGVMRYDGSYSTNWLWTKIGGQAAAIYGGYKEILAINPETSELWLNVATPTAVEESRQFHIASGFSLHQNYPNPFNGETIIPYTVPEPAPVELAVFNLLGQQVAVLVDRIMPAGDYAVRFDASRLASGLYICRLSSGEKTLTTKLMLMK